MNDSNTSDGAAEFLPPRLEQRLDLESLGHAASTCRGCELYKRATQTVFGEGARQASLVLVGEQPGDAEDLSGKPFIGPAGRLLRRALFTAGLDETEIYFTNAVKHFDWVAEGVRRLHKKPLARHIKACLPWLEAELSVLHPRVLVCLGATAARAILGRTIVVKDERGIFRPTAYCEHSMVTIHPSAILRIRARKDRNAAFNQFLADFESVATQLELRERGGAGPGGRAGVAIASAKP